MSSESRTPLRIAVEELARRRERPPAGERGTEGTEPADGGVARKRMFMAGRVGPEASRVHYGGGVRPPVDGPWDLTLVVRPR